MVQLVDDDEIYEGMHEQEVSADDLKRVANLINGWAAVTDKQRCSVRIVFLACLTVMRTMGPAWCKIAVINLRRVC